ncbi:DUF397 domain-containing protein [Dactylosporangium sp. CA-092794]|uniref:DUF397 domain-containing protein n=1 Tax=Dactylosporangium sp. CA-092794 TaxID=3239929 RepID=UPI003D8DA01E
MGPDRSAWRRASRCVSEHNCVEFSDRGPSISVRDSVIPAVALTFAADDWRSFVTLLKNDAFEGHQSSLGVASRVRPGAIGS